MRAVMRVLGLFAAMVVAASCAAFAQDAPAAAPVPAADDGKIVIRTVVSPKTTREYNVKASVKGTLADPDTAQPVPVDAVFEFKTRHLYSRREGDGVLPMDISLLEGRVTTEGQKLEITPSIYPKLTVLIDSDWRITDIYGMSGSRLAQSLPGINYGNVIMLFYLQGGDKPHAVGDKWENVIKLPNFGESYKFISSIKGVEFIDGDKVALVRQEITRLEPDQAAAAAAMKATAESVFSMADGKLIKSHVDCELTLKPVPADSKAPANNKSSTQQDQAPLRANIKVDISLAK